MSKKRKKTGKSVIDGTRRKKKKKKNKKFKIPVQ